MVFFFEWVSAKDKLKLYGLYKQAGMATSIYPSSAMFMFMRNDDGRMAIIEERRQCLLVFF